MTATIIFVAVLILAAVAAILLKARSPQPSHIRSKAILTPNELEFFHRLCRALPDLYIFPQVAANALLKVHSAGSKHHVTRNRFAQKYVDFVVCERESLNVVAIIELDDRTHRVEKDRARDAMFEGAGYTVHRFESRRKPSDAELKALFYPPAVPEIAPTDHF